MSPLRLFKKLLIITLVAATAQCGLLPKKTRVEKPLSIAANEDGSMQVLIRDGENSQASYSPDGDKVLFVSRKRPNHLQAQVYELNLNNGNLRRITFQNGDTSWPRYTPNSQAIIYASTTDELKETPSFLKSKAAPLGLPAPYQSPSELYYHSMRAFDITRLTSHNGFDGEEHFLNAHEITYTRVDGTSTKIMSQSLSSGKPAHEIKDLGLNPTQYVASPDGKARAWIDWDKDFAIAHLRLSTGKDKTIEISGDALVDKADPVFSADSKYLIWSQRNETRTSGNLWFTEVASVCPRVVFADDPLETRRQPVVSPDMRWLLFTSEKDGGSRIARVGFKPAEQPCPSPK